MMVNCRPSSGVGKYCWRRGVSTSTRGAKDLKDKGGIIMSRV